MEKHSALLESFPSMVWHVQEGRSPAAAAAALVVQVDKVACPRSRALHEPVLDAVLMVTVCAFGVCAQTACCYQTLRPTRPRRS